MAIFSSHDQFRKYRYVAKNIRVLIPGLDDIVIDNNRLNELYIEDNYEENYFPLIKITLVLNSEVYYNILSHKNDCKFFLKINKYYIKNDDEQDVSIEKLFLNDTFDLIMDENTDDMLNSLKEKINSSDYKRRKSEGSILDETDNNRLSFYLFKSSIAGTKTNVNKVLSNVNVSDAVAYLMTVAKIKNVLMAQPDNTKKYDEFLIPPLSVLKALAFIDTYYGLYKTGSIIYFGIDYTYIIPYNGKCDVNTKREVTQTNIVVPKSSNTDYADKMGSINKYKDESNYIIADYKTISIKNASISNNYINANSIQVIDSYDESSTTNRSTAKTKNDDFVKIFENKTENSFIGEMYAAQSNAKSDIVSLRLQDYDISMITPNKQFKVIFEDSVYRKKYSGNYILAGLSHSFISSGAELLLNSTVILRKV